MKNCYETDGWEMGQVCSQRIAALEAALAEANKQVAITKQSLYEAQNPMLPNGETITIPEMYSAWQKSEQALAERTRERDDFAKSLSHADLENMRLIQERAEDRAAIRQLDEAADFAYGALRDAVEDMLDKPAGYAVIRMIQDHRREHAPAIARASQENNK